MAKKCRTDPGQVWVCTVNNTFEGAFIVVTEDDAGNFEGIYSGDKIKGTCTGSHITFRRPATNSRYEYSGKFTANGRRIIDGYRRNLRKKPIRPRDDEEWEGTKTTTKLNLRSGRSR